MIETISRTGYAFLRYLATRLLRIDLMLLALVVTLFPRQIMVGTVNETLHKPGETYMAVSVIPSVELEDIQFATVILTNPNVTSVFDKKDKDSTIRRRAGR